MSALIRVQCSALLIRPPDEVPHMVVLMWCNSCGPLGVSPGYADAMMVGNRHLAVHGVDA